MSAGLERHYQRLIAWYPAAYRREYGEEMLGVLMHNAGDRKRRPGLAEVADLIRTALVLRLRGGSGRLVSPLWRDAASVLGLVAVLLDLARPVRPLASLLGWYLRLGVAPWSFASDWPRLAVWLAVAVAVLGGWWLAAVLGGALAVLIEAVSLVRADPAAAAPGWSLLLALATTALLGLGLGGRPARAVLGRRSVLLLGTAAVATGVLAPLVQTRLWQIVLLYDGPTGVGLAPYMDAGGGIATIDWYGIATFAATALLVLAALTGTAAPLRRRIVALALPFLVLLGLACLRLGTLTFGGLTFAPPLLVGSAWVPLLVLLPALVFTLAVLLVRRRERHLTARVAPAPPGLP